MQERYARKSGDLTHQQVVDNMHRVMRAEYFAGYHVAMGHFKTPITQVYFMGSWVIPICKTPTVKEVRGTLEKLLAKTTAEKDDPNRLNGMSLSLTAEENAPHFQVAIFPQEESWHVTLSSAFEKKWPEQRLQKWYGELDVELQKLQGFTQL